jgi:threonine synthase
MECVRISNIPKNQFKLHLKVETENPTRTFKDRGSAVEITKAKELGFSRVCCASTGNMGLSIAHYAKRASIKATIFISKTANKEKIKKIRKEGARIISVNGDFNKSLTEAEKFATSRKLFICGDYHYRKEGQKSVAFEIIEQLKYKTPDYIFVQVGNSTLLAGIYKGLREFKRFGLIRKIPRLVAVQSSGCDPLVSACRQNKKIKYTKPNTKADAIAVGYPTFGFEGLRAVRETGGFAGDVDDSEIEQANKVLFKSTGIKAELGGATGMAGFLKAYQESPKTFKGKEIVVIVTGNNETKTRS